MKVLAWSKNFKDIIIFKTRFWYSKSSYGRLIERNFKILKQRDRSININSIQQWDTVLVIIWDKWRK